MTLPASDVQEDVALFEASLLKDAFCGEKRFAGHAGVLVTLLGIMYHFFARIGYS